MPKWFQATTEEVYREGDIPVVPGALGLGTLGQLLPRRGLHPAAAGASRPAWRDPRAGHPTRLWGRLEPASRCLPPPAETRSEACSSETWKYRDAYQG